VVIFWPRPSHVILHTVTSSNIQGHWTEIDDASTNDNPEAIVLVTPNWNPPGQSGIYLNHPIGVWYTGSRWAIFNQDFGSMPQGASFNVQILNAGRNAFVHTATSSNTQSNWTEIDHARTNNNPEAIVLVTPNWNPHGQGGVYLNHPIGVWYTGSRWAIFNQDGAGIPQGASFNVQILNAGTDAFVHRATTSNIDGDYTWIDHARTNNNPEAIIFVTPNLSPPGMGGGVYLNHSIGVWYTGSRWAIFNQDIASMTQGPAFNVLILDLR
jgi:O-glycosyl hydrolase